MSLLLEEPVDFRLLSAFYDEKRICGDALGRTRQTLLTAGFSDIDPPYRSRKREWVYKLQTILFVTNNTGFFFNIQKSSTPIHDEKNRCTCLKVRA